MPDNSRTILLVSGPALDRLGERDPSLYGTDTLEDIENYVRGKAAELSVEVKCFQSDSEERIIEFLEEHRDEADGVIINPAALTHYSVGLAACLERFDCPRVEVHITNLYKREKYRHESITGSSCVGVIMGFGMRGYGFAVEYVLERI
jgi:3-dehydroquinate dehydratase-2